MPVAAPSRPLSVQGAPDDRHESPVCNSAEPNSQELSLITTQRLLAMGEMSRGFVHDFRNVLAVISAGLDLAKRQISDPVGLSASLAGAQEGVNRGLEMASRLLDFASGHDRERGSENVNVALNRLAMFLRFAAGPGIEVTLQLAPEVPDLELDSQQFNAAILNLVANARDAMPGGGAIQISTEMVFGEGPAGQARRPYIRVRVQDNGSGMSADVRRKIFDPFFTTKAGTGTGLGVPQIDTFVKRAGGFIAIESVIGVGSTFDLYFPTENWRSKQWHTGLDPIGNE